MYPYAIAFAILSDIVRTYTPTQVHPTTWVVAAGLQEARTHWEVQVTTQYSALLFNMAAVAGSYILGIAVFIMADLSAPSTLQEPLGVCYAFKMTRASNGGCRPLHVVGKSAWGFAQYQRSNCIVALGGASTCLQCIHLYSV